MIGARIVGSPPPRLPDEVEQTAQGSCFGCSSAWTEVPDRRGPGDDTPCGSWMQKPGLSVSLASLASAFIEGESKRAA
jgi:hypothetical protein